jgi:hypothetical protein
MPLCDNIAVVSDTKRAFTMAETTYAGSTIAREQDQPHLGGNVTEGDPYTFCPHVWEYVVDRFCVASVMDLGSGIGNTAHWFFKNGLRTIAIEGLYDNVVRSCYPAICYDLTKGPVSTSVDLVHCQEVVEHIEERYLESLLASLACGRLILMTHALPGQGGYHHVNEQSMDYWVHHLSRCDYKLMVEDTNRVRDIAAKEGAVYMEKSGLVFHRK